MPYSEAREFAKLSTVKKPNSTQETLPFGFNQSPIIASLCLQNSNLGSMLNHLNKVNNVKVSVYMDDIIISSNNKDKLQKIYNKVCTSFEKASFKINLNKSEAPNDLVSVFNIKLKRNQLDIEKKRLIEFKQKLLNTKNEYVIEGVLTYIGTINPRNIDDMDELEIFP